MVLRSPLLLILALAACAPAIPDSGAGVGFGDYSEYVRQRDVAPAPVVAPPQPGFSTERIGAAIDAGARPATALPPQGQQTGAIIGATPPLDPFAADRPRGNAPAGIQTQDGEVRRAAAISDENDFAAVSGRESIESNAERIAQQRAQYQVIAPTALPQRTAESGSSIVKFALATSHAPGTPVYKRSSLFGGDPARACARYIAPDLAQEAFLAKGGPERDKEGLDPDGDGFACGWDPRPFRTALR